MFTNRKYYHYIFVNYHSEPQKRLTLLSNPVEQMLDISFVLVISKVRTLYSLVILYEFKVIIPVTVLVPNLLLHCTILTRYYFMQKKTPQNKQNFCPTPNTRFSFMWKNNTLLCSQKTLFSRNKLN